MRYFAVATLAVLLAATAAHAQVATCKLQAIEKKLTGPTLTTFMKKCETEVQALCDKLADQRKLEAPNRTLFINNCVTSYVGP
jgi:hypothetical protein